MSLGNDNQLLETTINCWKGQTPPEYDKQQLGTANNERKFVLLNKTKINKMEWIISILASAVAFFLGAQFLEGVKIKEFVHAVIVALVIGLLNITLGIILKIVTLGLLSFGVFTLFLDAILIQVADHFLKGFEVKNFWWALALAVVVAVINSVLGWFF